MEECLWALYRINRNDGFIDNPKLGHITTFGAPCHCVSLFSYCKKLLKPT
jgi:hypothetical protein